MRSYDCHWTVYDIAITLPYNEDTFSWSVEMIYHLGEHLDLADKIAGMSPLQAMGELGRISLNMSAQTDVKLSAAPDPIEPLNSGGSISQEEGPHGATYE